MGGTINLSFSQINKFLKIKYTAENSKGYLTKSDGKLKGE